MAQLSKYRGKNIYEGKQMTDYFVRKESAIKLNKLLELDSTGDEQDWELELADIGKITSMLNLLENKTLNFHDKIALSHLIVASFEEENEELGEVDKDRIKIFADFLDDNLQIKNIIREYWVVAYGNLSKKLAYLIFGDR
ncbi:hypothetical protein [uncultured Campylobacter sp.]|uniref:hypothetical protein n=1 Tax=uncultured Campylobacter sp. TaxID=218934 RepID=UPI002635D220|nr:hypothetical protein [uncultured Campylobacter sp.]